MSITSDAPRIALVRQWILGQMPEEDGLALDDTTDFLKQGYIDSIAFLGLIVYIEDLLGHSITERQMCAENFSSLCVIEKVFFSTDPVSASAH